MFNYLKYGLLEDIRIACVIVSGAFLARIGWEVGNVLLLYIILGV